jgi:hypothetical protein
MVDIVVMPTVDVVVTTRRRQKKPAPEGGGSSLLPLPLRPRRQQQVQLFGSDQTMSMSTPP